MLIILRFCLTPLGFSFAACSVFSVSVHSFLDFYSQFVPITRGVNRKKFPFTAFCASAHSCCDRRLFRVCAKLVFFFSRLMWLLGCFWLLLWLLCGLLGRAKHMRPFGRCIRVGSETNCQLSVSALLTNAD